MTQTRQRKYRRPRLDPEAGARLRAEVAKLEAPPASVEIADVMRDLRDTLALPIEDEPEQPPTPAAAPVAPSDAAPALPATTISTLVPPTLELPHVARWQNLRRVPIDANVLDRHLVITANRTDPAHASFDVMRTRLVQALADKGWKRVAITSPTKGCGKTFTAVNLAVTLSRYENNRTILMDMDLRHPAVATTLGVQSPGAIGDVLRGTSPMADHLRRPGDNPLKIGKTLAFGLNDRSEPFAAELFQQPSTRDVLAKMEEDFAPDVILYDLPPALAFDDVMAFRPQFDCVLLVIGGGMTTAKEVNEVHRRLGSDKPVLGVILNMAEDDEDNTY